jgi:uncharacterized repeat protein (TIGR01451 family)
MIPIIREYSFPNPPRQWSLLLTTLAFWLLLGVPALRAAPPAFFTDPGGYPAAWPAQLGTQNYTSEGNLQADLSGPGDSSKGPAAFAPHENFSSGNPDGSNSSLNYYADGSVLYFRVRLASNPLELIGKGKVFQSTRWNILLDVDGDGYKEYTVQIDGATANTFVTEPDNFAVYYNNNNSQTISPASDKLWEQDVAGPSDGLDGGLVIDLDADSRIWDFGRTRVVQINTGLPAGDAGSEYFLDIQVPLQAFDASGLGGPVLAGTDCFGLAATTSNSTFDPTQQDLIYPGNFPMAPGARLTFGDVSCPDGSIKTPPLVKSIAITPCPAPVTLTANIHDAIIDDGTGVATDSLASVVFENYRDINSNGAADDGQSWLFLKNGVGSADPSAWTTNWDSSTALSGQYLIRVVVVDDQANQIDSDIQAFPGARLATFDNTCGVTGGSLTGSVYEDINHNFGLDGSEAGTGLTLFAKLEDQASPGTAAYVAIVDPVTGAFSFPAAAIATYNLIIDDNSLVGDLTPTTPASRVQTENAGFTIGSIVVGAGSAIGNQNFGLYQGSRLTGVVFRDDGEGGGTPNNGAQDGTEAALLTVALELRQGANAINTAKTDSTGTFEFWIPASVGAVALELVETNPLGHLSTGGRIGTTGGTYTRTTDNLAFTNVLGMSFSGIEFGDVPENRLVQDHTRLVRDGVAVHYAHTFSPHSGGDITYSLTEDVSPSYDGWGASLYEDGNCSGVLDAGEVLLASPVTVTANTDHCSIVRVFVPQGARPESVHKATLTASFNYTNAAPGLTKDLANVDTTTLSETSGLLLVKAVDKSSAAPGENVTYTVTYKNDGTLPVGTIIVTDSTPFGTTFVSASEGALPASLSSVVRTDPGIGGTGKVEWTFTGSLNPHLQGTVTFVVQIAP